VSALPITELGIVLVIFFAFESSAAGDRLGPRLGRVPHSRM